MKNKKIIAIIIILLGFTFLTIGHNALATYDLRPVVNISVNPSSIIQGQSSIISWTSEGAFSCQKSGAWYGNTGTSGSTIVTPNQTSTYIINCSNSYGSSSNSVVVNVINASEYIDISANPTSINSGNASVITWNSQNVSSCYKTNAWSGSVSLNGSTTVYPDHTSTFAITCYTNTGNLISDSVTIAVNSVYPLTHNYYYYYYQPSSNSTSPQYTSQYTYPIYSSSSESSINFSNVPNVNLIIKSRDIFSSSSFVKEISSQPGRTLDFQININNNSTNKIGNVFITLPPRLSYVTGSAYLDGVKLNISSISSIDLNYLSAPSQHSLTFQALVAPYNSFSESTTVLSVNVSAQSYGSSAYIASDYTNVLVYKNGSDSEGVVLGASTVNTGTGAFSTVLISALIGFLAVLSYLLVKYYKSAKKDLLKKTDYNLRTFISEKVRFWGQKTSGLVNKMINKALEIYDL
jgi:uncharacterized repeat protein (TIGR01451 family)